MSALHPPIWLLEKVRNGEAELTQTYALSRKLAREAAERWPDWWPGHDLFGPPNRAAEVLPLELLHDGCKRLKMVRRRARKLQITKFGRELLDQPTELNAWLAGDLSAQDEFTDAVAVVVVGALGALEKPTLDELTTLAHAAVRQGWRDLDGNAPDERELTTTVIEVTARGQGYGLIDRHGAVTQREPLTYMLRPRRGARP